MTGQQKTIAELVEAARELEAKLPAVRDLVLGEVRSAGYAVRHLLGDRGASDVYRFAAPQGMNRGPLVTVGLMLVQDGHVTYAEWNRKVYPQWSGWTQDERDASIRGLLLAIRDDQR